jgi:sortase A
MINNRISFNASSLKTPQVAGANTVNFDLEKPGRLSIPKLNLQVSLIWSKDPSNFDADLTKGVVHYPGTALPGENGIIYVSGHSSDYLWKRDPMHDVFARLNYLSVGDDIFIDVYGKDGKVYNFRYQVTGNHNYKPDDQAQFIDNSGSKLNLSTCWPIGTSKDRLVVSAVPVGL